MVGVAQLVERRLVVADVAGSSPVTHPYVRGPVSLLGCRPARSRPAVHPVDSHESRVMALRAEGYDACLTNDMYSRARVVHFLGTRGREPLNGLGQVL